MSWTETELAQLRRAYASGTLRVSYDGKSVEYGSAVDLLARIRTIEAEMARDRRTTETPPQLCRLQQGIDADELARPGDRRGGAGRGAAACPPAAGDGGPRPRLRGRQARPPHRGLGRRRHRRQRRDRPGDRPAPRPLARPRPQQPLRRQGGDRAGQQHDRHRAAAAGAGGDAGAGRAGRPALVGVRRRRRRRRPHRLLRPAGADRPQPGRERRGAGAAARAPGRGRPAGAAAAAGARGRPPRQRRRPRSCATAASSCRASSSTRSAAAAPTGSIRRIPATAAARWSRIGCRPIACCTSSSGCGPGRCAGCRGSRR